MSGIGEPFRKNFGFEGTPGALSAQKERNMEKGVRLFMLKSNLYATLHHRSR
jgi:hypothetical protein